MALLMAGKMVKLLVGLLVNLLAEKMDAHQAD